MGRGRNIPADKIERIKQAREQGKKLAEIAEAFDVSIGAVHYLLVRAGLAGSQQGRSSDPVSIPRVTISYERTCPGCLSRFTPERGNPRYCRKECRPTYKPPPPKHPCATCSKPIDPRSKYCSVDCRPLPRPKPKPDADEIENGACAVCGGHIRRSRGGGYKYCSDACRPRKQIRTRKGLKTRKYKAHETRALRDQYLISQGGACAVCGESEVGQFCLDHCHKTGEPRAVLCSGCNSSFGLLKESPERITALLEYARKWAAA
jgi:predicted nucleic acid-binding Zn ribbon protein